MTETKIKNYVVKLSKEQVNQLTELLKSQNWEFIEHPYAYWKAKHDKINVIAYESGKLVVQGKETEDFVLFTLEPEILKKASLGYEDKNDKPEVQFTPHIGIDESGKGDFFGPLVVAAVFVDHHSYPELIKLGVKDSKLIKNDNKILSVAKEIRSTVKGNFSVVSIGPEAYNRLYNNFRNLNKLLAWGHSRSLENLLDKEVNCTWALSDKFGDEKLIKQALFNKGKQIELKQQTKAESDIAVAAASILARAEFVTRIKKLSESIEIPLLKGAGKAVLETAVKIIKENGKDKLNLISKIHFKTYLQAIDLSQRQHL